MAVLAWHLSPEHWRAGLSRRLCSLMCILSCPRKIHISGQASVILLLLLLLLGHKEALHLLLKVEFYSTAPLLSLSLYHVLARPDSTQCSSSLFWPELLILLTFAQRQTASTESETLLNTCLSLFLSLLRGWTQGVTLPSSALSLGACAWHPCVTPVLSERE